MKCEEVRENLAACLDGEIEGAPRRAMDDHVAGCAACAAESRAQAAAWRLLDLAAPPGPVPAGLRDRILSRARAGGGGSGGRLLRLRLPAAAAAAVVLAAWGATHLLRGGRSPAEAPDEQILDNLPVLESFEALQDSDVDVADRFPDGPVDDTDLLGG